MGIRLSRVEQVERNRELVLEAARRVFLAKGYAGASLDAIAEAAGFSKGVVYSQFQSKADLFLALLERRITERAAQNDQMAARLPAEDVLTSLIRLSDHLQGADPDWTLLVIEFRAHAARDPELNERYGAAHQRTVARLAELFTGVHERAGSSPPFPPRIMAEFVLAIGSGLALERQANPKALPSRLLASIVAGALGPSDVPAAHR
jgi:AcrR family transcriptional regulator